jgi:hypothetical protein
LVKISILFIIKFTKYFGFYKIEYKADEHINKPISPFGADTTPLGADITPLGADITPLEPISPL